MYQIDVQKNSIKKLNIRRFAELGFGERTHLQEWLANNPEALGESLLIIQKEFDGFDDTRERLDLLALDKKANLVLVENKLDDSGRDVVWQALKYASYCSSLRKEQIVRIFQQYLDRVQPGTDATTVLCEFLEVQDLDEVIFNPGNNQRIVFVAAKFRKEVTSTVMWLISHGIRLQCFKVTAYEGDGQLLLDIDQIIPTPEVEDFIIQIREKEIEKDSVETELKQRHKLRLAFWGQALEALRNSESTLFNNISPSKDHWLNARSGISGINYAMIYGKKEARVDLFVGTGNTLKNKFIFDELSKRKHEIQAIFCIDSPLKWRRMDNNKSSIICLSKDFDGYNRDSWKEMIDWLINHVIKFEEAFKKPLIEINNLAKSNRQLISTDSMQDEIDNSIN
ncbi:MAG: DUF4268 domain-containing protein [Proteobacteria bacterium]|nr:DUF4268 domain-containing protein [Pseudomonadota bacterium]